MKIEKKLKMISDILDDYANTKMNGKGLALFKKGKRVFGLMKPNHNLTKYHPLLISQEINADISDDEFADSLTVVRSKEIDRIELDIMFEGMEAMLKASNLAAPNILIRLSQETINKIFIHFEMVSDLLQKHVDAQSIVLRDLFTQSKQELLSKTRMMFLLDLEDDNLEIYLQNIGNVQVDVQYKTLLALDTVLGPYQSSPQKIKQSKCLNIADTAQFEKSGVRYINFEIDFLDIDIMLENGFDMIAILDTLSSTQAQKSDTVTLRDYVCFCKPVSINQKEQDIDFGCLILPSYLK